MSFEGLIGLGSFVFGSVLVVVMAKLEAMGAYQDAPTTLQPQEPKA